MFSRKNLFRSAIIFSASYIAMMLPQTGIGNLYGDFFRSAANRFLGEIGDEGIVILKPQKNEKFDTMLFISKKSLWQGTSYKGDKYNISSRTIGFLPASLIIALILATPVLWKRKLLALFISLAAMTGFVLIKLYVIVLYKFQLSAWIGILQFEGESLERLKLLNDYFAEPLTPAYTLGIVLWIVFCFRKKDLDKIVPALNPATNGLQKTAKKDQPVSGKKKL